MEKNIDVQGNIKHGKPHGFHVMKMGPIFVSRGHYNFGSKVGLWISSEEINKVLEFHNYDEGPKGKEIFYIK